jgi:hypothetical protein
MNSNYINECARIVGKHNKHEILITIWDEPITKGSTLKDKLNEIRFCILIAMWFRSRPNTSA